MGKPWIEIKCKGGERHEWKESTREDSMKLLYCTKCDAKILLE